MNLKDIMLHEISQLHIKLLLLIDINNLLFFFGFSNYKNILSFYNFSTNLVHDICLFFFSKNI